MSDLGLRPIGDRVLVRRVHERTSLIAHVHEVMGKTDRVLQLGEVLALGPVWTDGNYRGLELAVGDLIVYPTPRVHDHFRWHFGTNGGACDVLVVPGYWIAGKVTEHLLAEHPECREYGDTLK